MSTKKGMYSIFNRMNTNYATNKKSRYGCKCRKKLATNSSCLRAKDLVDKKVGNEACFHSKPFCSFKF